MNSNIRRLHRVLAISYDVASLPLDLATATDSEAFDAALCVARAASTALAQPDELHSPEASAFLDRLEVKASEAATLTRCAYVQRVCGHIDAPAADAAAQAARRAYAMGDSEAAYSHAHSAACLARAAARKAGAAELLELA